MPESGVPVDDEAPYEDLIVRRQYTYEEEEAGDGSSTYPSTV
jgi:hypothetical protein